MKIPDPETLTTIWAKVPPDYYFQLNYFQKLWHEWKWLVFRHMLTEMNRLPAKVLEVGCASGHLTEQLAGLYPEALVVGIDVYAPAIKVARKRFPNLTFKIADAHQLPFKDGSFDLIVCSETIEHVVNPGKVLHEMNRVMTRRGTALVEMDSHSLLFRLIWWVWTNFGRGKVWQDAHLHPYTSAELDRLLTGNGFAVRDKIFSHFNMAVSFLITKKPA